MGGTQLRSRLPLNHVARIAIYIILMLRATHTNRPYGDPVRSMKCMPDHVERPYTRPLALTKLDSYLPKPSGRSWG